MAMSTKGRWAEGEEKKEAKRTGLNAMMMMVAWDGHASQTLAMM
jgi:hypothetical protein